MGVDLRKHVGRFLNVDLYTFNYLSNIGLVPLLKKNLDLLLGIKKLNASFGGVNTINLYDLTDLIIFY